jgi:hypothetical protein
VRLDQFWRQKQRKGVRYMHLIISGMMETSIGHFELQRHA